MRLQMIYIPGYRVLDHFTLALQHDSSNQHALDLLVGVNGTGKSTLLRALAEIFQYLDREQSPGFCFYLRYQLEAEKDIVISNLVPIEETDIISRLDPRELNPENRLAPLRLWVNGKEQTADKGKPIERIDPRYLPLWVLAFTSGSEKGWELPESWVSESRVNQNWNGLQNLGQLRDWYISERVGQPVLENPYSQQAQPESRFLFISADLIPLVVLCGLLQDMAQENKALRLDATVRERRPDFVERALNECKLAGLRGFSLKFRMNMELLDGDNQDFIALLGEKAHHSIQRGSDYLLVFSLTNSADPAYEQKKGVVRPEDMFVNDMTCINFFRKLVSLQKPGRGASSILREVNLFFAGNRQPQSRQRHQQAGTRHPQSPLLLFDWLSDGEQSFLGRLCLFAVFEADVPETNRENPNPIRSSEALILLDEPEVHFNDYWKRQLVRMLTEALQGTPRHVLMTTHSSITLSDVSDANIWILKRENDYTARADQPNIQTLGADPSDILVQVFGAENAVGAQSVKYIRQTIRAARERRYEERDNVASRKMLEQLRDKLGPGYWRYLVRQELDNLEQEGQQG